MNKRHEQCIMSAISNTPMPERGGEEDGYLVVQLDAQELLGLRMTTMMLKRY
jgi:hypothetical protein